jgi:hypothetical protein
MINDNDPLAVDIDNKAITVTAIDHLIQALQQKDGSESGLIFRFLGKLDDLSPLRRLLQMKHEAIVVVTNKSNLLLGVGGESNTGDLPEAARMLGHVHPERKQGSVSESLTVPSFQDYLGLDKYEGFKVLFHVKGITIFSKPQKDFQTGTQISNQSTVDLVAAFLSEHSISPYSIVFGSEATSVEKTGQILQELGHFLSEHQIDFSQEENRGFVREVSELARKKDVPVGDELIALENQSAHPLWREIVHLWLATIQAASKNQSFANLPFDKRLALQREFAERTEAIVYEAGWDDPIQCSPIVALINNLRSQNPTIKTLEDFKSTLKQAKKRQN